MNDRKMCMYVFESGYICGTSASVLADDNKWYCEGHAKSITPPNKACTRRRATSAIFGQVRRRGAGNASRWKAKKGSV